MNENGYLTEGKIFKIANKIYITQNAVKGENGLMWSKSAISLEIKVLTGGGRYGNKKVSSGHFILIRILSLV